MKKFLPLKSRVDVSWACSLTLGQEHVAPAPPALQTWNSRRQRQSYGAGSLTPCPRKTCRRSRRGAAMAFATAISSPQLRYCSSPPPRRPRCRCLRAVVTSASPRSEENIVIVGAGVAGLATALALRRLGVRAAVLEQGEALRAGGTSLTLFKNGWRVLDAVGVADELRAKYLRIQGCVPLPHDRLKLLFCRIH